MKKIILKISLTFFVFLGLIIFIQHSFPPQSHKTNLGDLYIIQAPTNQKANFDKRIFKNFLSEYKYNLVFADTSIVVNSVEELIRRLKISEQNNSWSKQVIALPGFFSVNKKILRAEIESSFRGESRTLANRNIIPLRSPGNLDSARDSQQLTDDIIYACDNYGGIAFWADSVSIKNLENKF